MVAGNSTWTSGWTAARRGPVASRVRFALPIPVATLMPKNARPRVDEGVPSGPDKLRIQRDLLSTEACLHPRVGGRETAMARCVDVNVDFGLGDSRCRDSWRASWPCAVGNQRRGGDMVATPGDFGCCCRRRRFRKYRRRRPFGGTTGRRSSSGFDTRRDPEGGETEELRGVEPFWGI